MDRRLNAEDAPPLRKNGDRLGKVALADHERRPIEHLPVDIDLRPQAPQAVAVGLDLIAVQSAVHDHHVDPNPSPAEPKLLEEDRISLLRVLSGQLRSQRRPDVRVSQEGGGTAHVASIEEQPGSTTLCPLPP